MSAEAGYTLLTSLDIDKEQTPLTRLEIDDGVIRVLNVRASTNDSFEGLTIPVTVHLDPRTPRTTYAGVTATGLTIRDVSDPSILQGGGC